MSIINYEQKYLKYKEKNLKYDCKEYIKSNNIKDYCEINSKGTFSTQEECAFSKKCNDQYLRDRSVKPLPSVEPLPSFKSAFEPAFKSPQMFDFKEKMFDFKEDYSTPLNKEEYTYSKSVEIINRKIYNPDELRGFFTHGIHNNIETFINVIKDKAILPRNKQTSCNNTLTGLCMIDPHTISLSTISLIYPTYKIYGEEGITFITNKINDMTLTKAKVNMANEFLINQLNISKTALLLDAKLQTMKIKDVSLLEKLNIHSPDYKNVIKQKILFLIDEYKVVDIDTSIIIKEEDIVQLKRIYFEIINKIFRDKTFLEVIIDILNRYEVAIPIIFLNYT